MALFAHRDYTSVVEISCVQEGVQQTIRPGNQVTVDGFSGTADASGQTSFELKLKVCPAMYSLIQEDYPILYECMFNVGDIKVTLETRREVASGSMTSSAFICEGYTHSHSTGMSASSNVMEIDMLIHGKAFYAVPAEPTPLEHIVMDITIKPKLSDFLVVETEEVMIFYD